ncbi:MAG: hypothetical protein Q9223_002521 [Gallowayella weberi]
MIIPSRYSTLTVPILSFLLYALLSFGYSIPQPSAPSRFHHNVTVPSLGTLRINCFIQPPMPLKRLEFAEVKDCYVALQYLLRGDKTMAPIQFTIDERRGFRVPFAWAHDTCQVIINNLTPTSEETFSFALIAHLGAEITESCIWENGGRAIGGDVRVGNKELFEVVVAGRQLRAGTQGTLNGTESQASTGVAVGRRGILPTVRTSW